MNKRAKICAFDSQFDWLAGAVEVGCVNFMSELSKHKLLSQLTFPVPIALNFSHDKLSHWIGKSLPFWWKRIILLLFACSAMDSWYVREVLVVGEHPLHLCDGVEVSFLIKILTKTVSCDLYGQWKGKWSTCKYPACIQHRGVLSHCQPTMLSLSKKKK